MKTPKMSKAHFELIADTLKSAKDVHPDGMLTSLVYRFADALAATNPAFNRARFIAAALGEEA